MSFEWPLALLALLAVPLALAAWVIVQRRPSRYGLAFSNLEVLAGVGEMGAALRAAAGDDARVVAAADVPDLWPALESRLAMDAVILLKASRGVKLERLVPSLTAWATR